MTRTMLKQNRFLFLLVTLCVFTACDKPNEFMMITASVNGEAVSYKAQCYALKAVFHNEDGSLLCNKYTINGIDATNHGVYFQIIDSTSVKNNFLFEDIDSRFVYYQDLNASYMAIDAALEITKEETDLLCGNFFMLVLKDDGDTINIADGHFELSLETQNIVFNR